MSIGSFLATAGRAGQSMRAEEQAMREAQQQQLAIEALNRDELERREVNVMPPAAAAPPEFKLGAQLPVIEPEVIKAAAAPAAAPAPAGIKTDTAPVTTPAVLPAAAPKGGRGMVLDGKVIVPLDRKKPDRLNTAGVAGFAKIDPNMSDFRRAQLEQKNEFQLNNTLRALGTQLSQSYSTIRKPFVSQEEKKRIENSDYASSWYKGEEAKVYFRRNPEMLAVADKNPLGFFNGLVKANALAKQKAATTPAAKAGVAPSGATILANGFPKSYKDPAYDFAEQKAAAKVGVPVELLQAVRLAGEKTDADKISSAGARTPYQFTPQTRKLFINKYKVDPWSTPINAATAAAYHLKESLDKGLSNEDALREYHGGPDRSKWGKVNNEYASRTMAFLGGAPATGGGAGGVQLASGVAETPIPERIDPSNFYRRDPNAVSRDMQVALQQRDELKQMADIYQRIGKGAEYRQATLAVRALDNSMAFLQGMQGINELAMARDPSRLAAVWSYYTGVPVQLQPQTDGTYNVMVNNSMVQRGVSPDTIISSARSAFDQEYRNAQASSASAMSQKQFESDLKIKEKAAETLATFTSAIQQEKLKGANARSLEEMKFAVAEEIKLRNPEAKVTTSGENIVVTYANGRVDVLDPGGGTVEVNGQQIVTGPSMKTVAPGVGG